jgi:hypothetical protein
MTLGMEYLLMLVLMSSTGIVHNMVYIELVFRISHTSGVSQINIQTAKPKFSRHGRHWTLANDARTKDSQNDIEKRLHLSALV